MTTLSFSDFGFSDSVLAALTKKGFEEPTPIQALAIPKLLVPGPNLLARARTGTGKTAAFGLPIVNGMREAAAHVRALVLVPTRELAVQVAGEISSLAGGAFPRVAAIYGGAAMYEQLRRLARGVDVVVGTPGRVLDHMNRGTLDLAGIEWLVLDEADEMLDMGFIEDIETVLARSNPDRRVILFSATMPQDIQRIARKHLGGFETVEDRTDPVEAGLTDQIWLEVRQQDKLEALCRIVDTEEEFYGLIFCHTKIETDAVASALSERGYAAEALHGDVSQDMRERILGRFKDRKTLVLVATDVAARGIDIDKLTHVVNYGLPFDTESYTHRIGRTGRAGNRGTAITFVTPSEYRRLFALRKASGDGLRKGEVPTVEDVIGAKRGRILAKAADLARDILGAIPLMDSADSADSVEIDAADASGEPGAAPVAPADAGIRAVKPDAKRAGAFYALADELLAAYNPRDALAALAAAAYAEDLDPKSYGEVRAVSVDGAATARLYVGVGKRDGAWKKEIAAIVKKLTGLPDRLVDAIEVLESYSFVTIPFEAAERAIAEAAKARGSPPVRIATPKPGEQVGGQRPRSGAPYGKGPRGPREYGPRSRGPRPEGSRDGGFKGNKPPR